MPTYGPDPSGEFLKSSPIDYMDALPGSGSYVGHLVNLTTGTVGLYSWNGSTWIGPFGTGGGGGGGAPTTADYLVRTADAGLSAERVVTDTAEVTWDWATAGQAKASIGAIAQSKITNLVSDLAAKVPTSRTISTTAPLTGGGDLSANRTLAISDATDSTKGVVELATSGENAANVVVQGNDSRLSDSRAPTGAASGDLTGTYPGPTIAAGVVSNSKLANMANGTYKARITAGAGAPEDIPLSGTAFPTSPTPVDGQMFYRTDHRTVYVYNAATSIWLSVQVHEVPYGQTTATATNGFFKVGGNNGSATFSANFGHLFGFNVAIVGISWRSVAAPVPAGTATVAVFANNVAVVGATMNLNAADTSKTREDFLPANFVTAGQTIQIKNTGAATSSTAAQGTVRFRRRET